MESRITSKGEREHIFVKCGVCVERLPNKLDERQRNRTGGKYRNQTNKL